MKVRFRACSIEMSDPLNLAKELYFFEIERRDKLNSASAIPIGFLTLAAAAITYAATTISGPLSIIEVIALVLMVIATVAGATFVFFTITFFYGPIYKYLASADSLIKYQSDLSIYIDKYARERDPNAEFETYMLEQFSNCATINCNNNDRKSAKLFRMNVSALAMLVSTLMASVLVGSNALFTSIGMTESSTVAEKGNAPPPPPIPPQPRDVRDGANGPRPIVK